MSGSFERVEEIKYLGKSSHISILFRKKLRAVCHQGMLAITRCYISRLPVRYPKI